MVFYRLILFYEDKIEDQERRWGDMMGHHYRRSVPIAMPLIMPSLHLCASASLDL